MRDLGIKPDSRAIVRAIIALGRSLDMQILAEGVETLEQLSGLRDEGCGEVQGYYFSPPRRPEEIPALLRRLEETVEEKEALLF